MFVDEAAEPNHHVGIITSGACLAKITPSHVKDPCWPGRTVICFPLLCRLPVQGQLGAHFTANGAEIRIQQSLCKPGGRQERALVQG